MMCCDFYFFLLDCGLMEVARVVGFVLTFGNVVYVNTVHQLPFRFFPFGNDVRDSCDSLRFVALCRRLSDVL